MVTAYAIANMQDRGGMFVSPATVVYELVEITPHSLRMRKRVLAQNMRPRCQD